MYLNWSESLLGWGWEAYMIAATSAMSVTRTSYIRHDFLFPSIMQSRIWRAIPIIRSHMPPMWDTCGGLNTQVQFYVLKYFSTFLKLRFVVFISNSREAPTKFVPQSDRICFAGPLTAKNLLKALMKLLEHMHENITAHLLELECPPLVHRETTSHGPKTSTPTYVKGGAICNRWWVGHLLMLCLCPKLPASDAFAPTNQNSAARIAPSVRCLPWCFTSSWWW